MWNDLHGDKALKYRELKPNEYELLKDFLYEAIFIPEGTEAPDRSIIELPELALYYEDFGSGPADYCMAADDEGHVVGAIWSRIMNDYGHVDDETPSLAMSVLKEYRNKGIGTQLLREMLLLLKEKGYKRVSLSVQKANYAVGMYKKAGFVIADEKDGELIMANEL
ncbi:MAG: GNAT family N-acetyltransferase [Clostridiales bacterium]|nr:GNAT family N-acetyltransferase [Clostridiales bacterium]